MKINIIKKESIALSEVISDRVLIGEVQDALDLMADCSFRDSRRIILRKENFTPAFFDLKSGIAGEILQKFSTYDVRLAIIGDFSTYESKSLRDFIYESNKTGRINFVAGLEEAVDALTRR